jgi:hypothetical protein
VAAAMLAAIPCTLHPNRAPSLHLLTYFTLSNRPHYPIGHM